MWHYVRVKGVKRPTRESGIHKFNEMIITN